VLDAQAPHLSPPKGGGHKDTTAVSSTIWKDSPRPVLLHRRPLTPVPLTLTE